ncbi:MAG: SDR family oxidoreductase [Chloroflexi bacterium]|nr:SDR family oxidoreductase [Chloroflexota bacterium]
MDGSLLPLALVTGAARRVGKAVALELARQGFAIGLHAHLSTREAESTAAEIADLGVPVFRFTADLTDPAQIDRMFAGVAELSNPLRVLVNSAGIMEKGDLRELPVEAWDKTLDLNLRAPWLCARAAAKLMAARPEAAGAGPAGGSGGVIINITDSGAQKAWTSFPAYIVSKAGLEALTRLMARAFAPEVRVNAVAPGLILPSADMPPEAWQRLVDRLPLKAAGQPEDIARAVVFFVQNPYVTGQTLAVDGGYQLV